MPAYVQAHLDMGCAGVLAMPNTKPPVARVTGTSDDSAWTIENYLEDLRSAGAMAELLERDVLAEMAERNIVLCIHGEQHALAGEDYFAANRNAEAIFYRETMPRVLDANPKLRIVCEHITTADAAEFVRQAGDRVGATVTPQHLLYTIGHLIQGLKYHLFCLPVVKFDQDRDALRAAVTRGGQSQFFAGTDSAPHTTKATECGCAAGCFTGGCAPQLYAMSFEEAGVDLGTDAGRDAFKGFLCDNGPAFYGLKATEQTFAMEQATATCEDLTTPAGPVVPLPKGIGLELTWSLTAD